MGARLGLHDLAAVTAVVLGIPIEEGRAPDNFLEIDPQAQFETVQSADGLVIRCKTRNRVTPVMLNILQGSAESAKLWALHAADEANPGGAGVGPFLVEDANGSTLITGTCWIKKAPKRTFGNVQKFETWELELNASPTTIVLGGTDSPE
jgi:hypothetical protein